MGAAELIVASRASPLARLQVEEALAAVRPLFPPNLRFESLCCQTPGDTDLQTALTDPSVPDDFFTRDLDDALIDGRADLAVHSAKDLPQHMREGLAIAALLPARDIRDAIVFRADAPPGHLPSTIGTSSPRRSEALATLFPGGQLKPIRGTIQQRLEQLDRGAYDAVVVAACALQRLGLEGRISAYLPYDPAPQQGRLAIVTRSDRKDLLDALRAVDVRRTAGLVALVGCPADPALLSQRARRYLARADIVLHDRLIPDDILRGLGDRAEPVGKMGGHKTVGQHDIHRRMLEEAERGKLVVRLHGGDPCIYGHLSEELEFLAAWNLRVDVVTAPTAAQIASAHALAPLTHRGDGGRILFIPGYKAAGHQPDPLPGPGSGNLAIYMGVTAAAEIRQRLLAAGWTDDTPLIAAQRLGYPDEQIVHARLADAAALELARPAVFLIGMRSFPHHGWTLFVGTNPDHFLNYGPLIHWPLIRLEAAPLAERVAAWRRHRDRIEGVLFPSRYAVETFMQAVLAEGDARDLKGLKLLAVGPSTAEELLNYGLRADAGEKTFGGVASLAKQIAGKFSGSYLYPCSDAAPREDRTDALRPLGIALHPEIFYKNQRVDRKEFPRLPIGRVLFTSTSAVTYYFDLYPEERQAKREWLAVGPSTLKALQRLGLEAEAI